jgi:2-oxoisovalerate dehydrogenase E1 component alpha subunit
VLGHDAHLPRLTHSRGGRAPATRPEGVDMTESDPAETGVDGFDGMVQLLQPDGRRRDEPEYSPRIAGITPEALRSLYRDLVLVRRLDVEATALQRQGELALWAPLLGQEAAQVGSVRALRVTDFVIGSYREHAVAWCRGATPAELLSMWRGTALSGWDPVRIGVAVPAIVVGSQALHAVGYAMGVALDGADAVVAGYFGDGASSQGDVSEALTFAASFRPPVVFFCQNNQWAISVPVRVQTAVPLAERAAGFGIPGVRVDGNDVLAVLAVTRHAVERAREGQGPMLIEAVTYRMGPHTTSDDPTRYRTAAEVEAWRGRDPIERLRRLLEREGWTDSEHEAGVRRAADELAARLRQECHSLPDPDPGSVFDHVFAEPHPGLERQREEYARYLAAVREGAS